MEFQTLINDKKDTEKFAGVYLCTSSFDALTAQEFLTSRETFAKHFYILYELQEGIPVLMQKMGAKLRRDSVSVSGRVAVFIR